MSLRSGAGRACGHPGMPDTHRATVSPLMVVRWVRLRRCGVCEVCTAGKLECPCGESQDLMQALRLNMVCLDNNCLGNCDRWHFI